MFLHSDNKQNEKDQHSKESASLETNVGKKCISARRDSRKQPHTSCCHDGMHFYSISILLGFRNNYRHYVWNLINRHTENVRGEKKRKEKERKETHIELLSQIEETGYMSIRNAKKTVRKGVTTPAPLHSLNYEQKIYILIRIKFLTLPRVHWLFAEASA